MAKHMALVMRNGVCALEEIEDRPAPWGDLTRPLHDARIAAGVGLREVADDLGHAAAYVSGIEYGRIRPADIDLLRYYGDRFGVDIAPILRAMRRERR